MLNERVSSVSVLGCLFDLGACMGQLAGAGAAGMFSCKLLWHPRFRRLHLPNSALELDARAFFTKPLAPRLRFPSFRPVDTFIPSQGKTALPSSTWYLRSVLARYSHQTTVGKFGSVGRWGATSFWLTTSLVEPVRSNLPGCGFNNFFVTFLPSHFFTQCFLLINDAYTATLFHSWGVTDVVHEEKGFVDVPGCLGPFIPAITPPFLLIMCRHSVLLLRGRGDGIWVTGRKKAG